MRYEFPCEIVVDLEEEREAYVVRFPDVYGANTGGWSWDEAVALAQDALSAALGMYVERREDVPTPSRRSGDQVMVSVPANLAAKIALYKAMREQGITNVALAARLGLGENAVRRLIDPDHRSHMDHLERALHAVERSVVVVDDAPLDLQASQSYYIKAPNVAAFQAEGNRITAERVYADAWEEARKFESNEIEYYGPEKATPSVWDRAWTVDTAPAWGLFFAAVQLAAESAEVFLKVLWSDCGTIAVDRSHDLVRLWGKIGPEIKADISTEAKMPQGNIAKALAALKGVHTNGRYLGETHGVAVGHFRAEEFFSLLAAFSAVTQRIIPDFNESERPAVKDCLACRQRMDSEELYCPFCGNHVWNDLVPWMEFGKSQPLRPMDATLDEESDSLDIDNVLTRLR